MYLKVPRPSRVAALHQRHRLLTAAGVPAPHSYGYTPDGLLVLAALPGRSLREVLATGGPVPPGGRSWPCSTGYRPSSPRFRPANLAQRAGHYAAVLAGALPAQAEAVTELGAAITAEAGVGPIAPVHGDLYESQLHARHTAEYHRLLDVDTAGPGDRLDDLACPLGHLSVLATLDLPRGRPWSTGTEPPYLAAFEPSVDPAELRYRVAAVVLSLATGPHRVQEPGWPQHTRARLDLARQWLASARALRDGHEVLDPGHESVSSRTGRLEHQPATAGPLRRRKPWLSHDPGESSPAPVRRR